MFRGLFGKSIAEINDLVAWKYYLYVVFILLREKE